MAGVNDKAEIGTTGKFLEGVSVDTPAGADLFREGVVVSDPVDPEARQRVTDSEPLADDYGAVVRVIGMLQALADVAQAAAGALTNDQLRAAPVPISTGAALHPLGEQLAAPQVGLVTQTVIHGETTGGSGGYRDVKVTPSGALTVEASVTNPVTVGNFPAVQQTRDTADIEYTPVATTVEAADDTTVYTPAAGKRVRLHWIYAINDPVATSSTKITVKLGAQVYYVAWAISKRQQFTGPVDGPLVINLSAPGNVAVTAFVEEI